MTPARPRRRLPCRHGRLRGESGSRPGRRGGLSKTSSTGAGLSSSISNRAGKRRRIATASSGWAAASSSTVGRSPLRWRARNNSASSPMRSSAGRSRSGRCHPGSVHSVLESPGSCIALPTSREWVARGWTGRDLPIRRRRAPGLSPGDRGAGPGREYSGCWRPSWTGRGRRRLRRWRAPRNGAGPGSRDRSAPCG